MGPEDYAFSPQAAGKDAASKLPPPDLNAAITEVGRLAFNPAASKILPGITDAFKNLRPDIKEGFIVGPGGNITGAVPKVDLRTGTVTTAAMKDGKLDFTADVLKGAKEAEAFNTLPTLEKGQQYLFDSDRKVAGIIDANGFIQSLANREAAVVAARESQIPREYTTSTGAKEFKFVTPPGIRPPSGVQGAPVQGAPVVRGGGGGALTTAQATLNEAFKPILADAYKGYQTAKKTAPVIDQLENAYNQPNFDTGAFTNVRTQLGNVFNSLGVSGERNKEFLKNAISARQGINALTGESLSEAVGAISNFEIGYYGQRNAQITDPKESTKFNLAVLREANNRKQEYYNFISDEKNAGPDAIRKWEASPQGQRGMFEAPSLRKYLPQRKVEGGPDKGKTAYQLPSGVFRVYD